jgi:hypothetical protein
VAEVQADLGKWKEARAKQAEEFQRMAAKRTNTGPPPSTQPGTISSTHIVWIRQKLVNQTCCDAKAVPGY